MNLEELVAVLRTRREELRYTQRYVALMMTGKKENSSYHSSIENGRHLPSLEYFLRWAEILGMEVLVREKEPMVCNACKAAVHNECHGGTWCDCQHRVDQFAAPAEAYDLPAGELEDLQEELVEAARDAA